MTNIQFKPLITCLFTAFLFTACAPLGTTNPPNPWGQTTTTEPAPTEPSQTEPTPTAPAPAQPVKPKPKPVAVNPFNTLPAVNVAILLPLSGSKAALGQSMLQGAQLSLFDMGYTNFNLMPRDTGGTRSGASAAATSAVNDGAQLILGPLFADSVRAVKPIAKANNVNVIAFSTDWTLADNNTFLMGFMPFSQVNRVARYALSKGHKNYGLVASQDPYGNAVSGQFSELVLKNGGTLSKSIRYTAGDDSLIHQLGTLKPAEGQASDLDAVFMPASGSQIDLIASSLSYNNLLPSQVRRLGTGLWDDPRIARQPNMEGAWFAAPSPASRRGFETKYAAAYGQQPLRLASLAHDATALAAILARNGYKKNGQPDYNYNALTNPNGFSGTDGVFRFQKNGLVEGALSVLEFRNGSIVEVDPAPRRF